MKVVRSMWCTLRGAIYLVQINVQSNAIQCHAMPCNAMQCNAMQCKAVQSNTTQCKAVQSNTMQCKAVQSNAAIRGTPRRSDAGQCSA
eukprot:4951384-Pyramimonas_sp.AAC.1